MIKICKECGKEFNAKHGKEKYCSNFCRMNSIEKSKVNRGLKRKSNESLCWTCKNACGGCSWSRNFEPVKGWEAEEIDMKGYYISKDGTKLKKDIKSYKVINCPEYEKGR